MATHLQRYISILVKWPISPQKKTRDYAYHLRSLLKGHKEEGTIFPGNPADFPKMLNSLLRLSENKYGLKYPCNYKKGASGLEKEDVAIVLSDEFINYYNSGNRILRNFFQ